MSLTQMETSRREIGLETSVSSSLSKVQSYKHSYASPILKSSK